MTHWNNFHICTTHDLTNNNNSLLSIRVTTNRSRGRFGMCNWCTSTRGIISDLSQAFVGTRNSWAVYPHNLPLTGTSSRHRPHVPMEASMQSPRPWEWLILQPPQSSHCPCEVHGRRMSNLLDVRTTLDTHLILDPLAIPGHD